MAENEHCLQGPPALETVLRDRNPVEQFHLLDQESQTAILSFLLEDYGFLRRRMPSADLVVLCEGALRFNNESDSDAIKEEAPSRPVEKAADANADVMQDDDDDDDDGLGIVDGSCDRPVVPGLDGRVNLMHDPYCLRTYFRSAWRLVGEYPPFVRPGEVKWDSEGVHYETGNPGLQRGNFLNLLMAGRPVKEFRPPRVISSQLMLYRVMASFGPLPRIEVDGYKQLWMAVLKSRADHHSTLVITEHKGWVEVAFRGDEERSKGALQLLDWLVGDNIPHSYDYTLAGCHA